MASCIAFDISCSVRLAAAICWTAAVRDAAAHFVHGLCGIANAARALFKLVDAAAHGAGLSGDALDHGGDFLEGVAGGVDSFRAALYQCRAFLHDFDGVSRLLLDRGDQLGDLACGYARLLGELSDFLGDDGETASVLARARRFDRGVECEEVRLPGDGGDGVDDRADLVGLLAEDGNDFGGMGYGLRDALHLLHGFIGSCRSLRCCAVRPLDGVDRLREIVGESAHVLFEGADLGLCAIHFGKLFVARACHLRHGAGDLGADRGGLVGALVELPDGEGDFFRRLDGLLHHATYIVLQRVERFAHPADLIFALDLDFERGIVAEVARGERRKALRHPDDGACQPVAAEDRQGDAQKLDQERDEHRHAQTLVEIRIDGFLLCRDKLVDLVDPDARAQDPVVGRERRGVIALGQGRRFARLGERQIGVAAARLFAVFQHLLNEVDAVGIDEIDAGLSFDVAPQEDDVHALFRVDPEVAFAIVIAQVAHDVGGEFLRLRFGELACLLTLVNFVDHADDDFCLVLQGDVDVVLQLRAVVRQLLLRLCEQSMCPQQGDAQDCGERGADH